MVEYTISVVIPTRNRQEELLRAIDSVRTQSRLPHEIIVVDDHSDFPVNSFLRARYGDLIHVITNDINLGAAESRNIGARAAKGEYVAFLDSDDYWHPDKLEKQLHVIDARKGVGLVYCNTWVFTVDGRKKQFRNNLFDTQLWEHLLQGWIAPNTSTLVFKRSVFLQLGGFDSQLWSCQDHDLWMRLAQSQILVAYCPEPLSYVVSDAPFRITRDYENRLNGMRCFLDKWQDPIVESRGWNHYRRFRANYSFGVGFALALHALRQKELTRAISIAGRYLIFTTSFYRRLGHSLFRKFAQCKPFHR